MVEASGRSALSWDVVTSPSSPSATWTGATTCHLGSVPLRSRATTPAQDMRTDNLSYWSKGWCPASRLGFRHRRPTRRSRVTPLPASLPPGRPSTRTSSHGWQACLAPSGFRASRATSRSTSPQRSWRERTSRLAALRLAPATTSWEASRKTRGRSSSRSPRAVWRWRSRRIPATTSRNRRCVRQRAYAGSWMPDATPALARSLAGGTHLGLSDIAAGQSDPSHARIPCVHP